MFRRTLLALLFQQELDDDAVPPGSVEPGMVAVDADFPEAEATAERPARGVLGKTRLTSFQ
jgi:hypothetical protein